MMFANPRALWLMLVTMSLLVIFLWWAWRKKQSLIRQFVHSRLFEQLTFGVSTKLQITRIILVVVAVAFLFLAMARPQWGFTWEEATQRGRDIVVAIDTSRSMLARDIAPNRLERAKLAALDLLKLSQGDRLGLVSFAGTAFLQCPLTLDDEAFRQSVQILEPGIIPQGGTAIGEAIDAALTAFKEEEGSNHKVIVLLTDGEDHDEQAITKVEKAAQAGARIFTVGVGTANGELLKIVDENGRETFLKDDEGNVVKSRLNEKLLQKIASAAHGFYLPLQGAGTMEKLYESGLAPLPTSEGNSTLYKRYKEQFFWPLLIGLILLVAELFVPERKRMKNSTSKVQSPAIEKTKKAASALVLLMVVFYPSAVMASPSRAMKNYEAGQYKDALSEYKRSLDKRPDDPRLHYNAGAAAYRAKQFEEASREFNAALVSPDLNLQQKAYYNLGNTEYRRGESEVDPNKKKETWEQSLKHFESALKLNQKDADAEFNRNFVQKMIEQLEQQQKQKQNQKGDNKDNKDQQKQENQEKDKQEQGQDNKDSQEQQKQKQDNQEQQKQKQDNQDQQKQDGKGEDQEKQNQEQNEKKDGEEQSSNNEPKPGEGDQEKEQQNASNEQDKKSSDQQAQNGKQNEQEQPGSEADQQAMSAALGKMTPAQAKQLLDAQKTEEKAMIFLPQKGRSGKANRFKDW